METGVSAEKAWSILRGEAVETTKTLDERNLAYLKVDEVITDLKHPRKSSEPDESLKYLAESIKEFGVLESILVQKDASGKIHLLDGNRRLQAAKMAGLERVPVLFLNPKIKLPHSCVSIIKNSFKKPLSPLDEAEVMQDLMREHSCSLRALRLMTAKSDKELGDILSLNNLPDWVKEEYRRLAGFKTFPAKQLIQILKKDCTEEERGWKFEEFVFNVRLPQKRS